MGVAVPVSVLLTWKTSYAMREIHNYHDEVEQIMRVCRAKDPAIKVAHNKT
jgi:hypothetical protein